MIVFYEMDFGLNTVKRKSQEIVPNSAHMLLSVPSGNEGPGGVMILCEGFLIYRSVKGI